MGAPITPVPTQPIVFTPSSATGADSSRGRREGRALAGGYVPEAGFSRWLPADLVGHAYELDLQA